MRGRNRKTQSGGQAANEASASAALLANQLIAAGMASAPTGSDPVLGIARPVGGYGSRPQAGELTGLTPVILGQYMDEFYAGRYAAIAPVWERMERTDDACAVARLKRRGKTARQVAKWRVVADDDSPAAARHAEFLEGFYARLRADSAIMPAVRGRLRLAAAFMLDAVGKQFSMLAKTWSGRGDELTLTLRHVPLWFFRAEAGEFRYSPVAGSTGAPVEPGQWVVCAAEQAVMEAAGVAVLLKRLPLHQAVNLLQKWGVPNVYGTTSAPPDSDAWQALFAALQNIRSGWTGILSGDSKIEGLDNRHSGSLGGLQRALWADLDRAITSLWLGSHLGTRAEGDTGALAGGAQADDTEDVIAADCDWLTEILEDQVTPDAIRYGVGDSRPLARIVIEQPDATDDDGDLSRIVTAVEKLGLRIPAAYLHDRFGWPVAADGEPAAAPLPRSGGSLGFGAPSSAAPAAAAPAAPAGETPAPCSRPHPAAAITRDLDALAERAQAPVADAIEAVAAPAIAAIADAPNLAVALARIESRQPGEEAGPLADIIAQTAFAAAMRGLLLDRDDIPAAPAPAADKPFSRLFSAAKRLLRAPAAQSVPDIAPLPFDAAEAFWRAKRLVRSWSEIGAATYEQAVAYGFKVAGISSRSILAMMHADVLAALAGEKTIDELISDLRGKYGLNPEHAKTVARTNVQTAYHWGHYRQLADPAVLAAAPIWAWDVVDDDDTSEICRALVGRAAPADAAAWDSLYPPNHYNCRTAVVALSPEEAAEQGFAISSAWPRDPVSGAEIMSGRGFEINVGRVASLADAIREPA